MGLAARESLKPKVTYSPHQMRIHFLLPNNLFWAWFIKSNSLQEGFFLLYSNKSLSSLCNGHNFYARDTSIIKISSKHFLEFIDCKIHLFETLTISTKNAFEGYETLVSVKRYFLPFLALANVAFPVRVLFWWSLQEVSGSYFCCQKEYGPLMPTG